MYTNIKIGKIVFDYNTAQFLSYFQSFKIKLITLFYIINLHAHKNYNFILFHSVHFSNL